MPMLHEGVHGDEVRKVRGSQSLQSSVVAFPGQAKTSFLADCSLRLHMSMPTDGRNTPRCKRTCAAVAKEPKPKVNRACAVAAEAKVRQTGLRNPAEIVLRKIAEGTGFAAEAWRKGLRIDE